MRRLPALVLSFALLLSACTSPLKSAMADKPFVDWYATLARQINADPSYRRIPLDTTDQAQEFVGWMHQAYRGEMSHEQFAQTVHARYPGTITKPRSSWRTCRDERPLRNFPAPATSTFLHGACSWRSSTISIISC